MTSDFVIIQLWPFADEFNVLGQHPDESVRREFYEITGDSLADCDQKTERLRALQQRVGGAQA